jgi:hypothetical protein
MLAIQFMGGFRWEPTAFAYIFGRLEPSGCSASRRVRELMIADDPIWPRTLEVTADDDVYADFEVCPFTTERKGEMQLVCIESASHVFVKHFTSSK